MVRRADSLFSAYMLVASAIMGKTNISNFGSARASISQLTWSTGSQLIDGEIHAPLEGDFSSNLADKKIVQRSHLLVLPKQ